MLRSLNAQTCFHISTLQVLQHKLIVEVTLSTRGTVPYDRENYISKFLDLKWSGFEKCRCLNTAFWRTTKALTLYKKNSKYLDFTWFKKWRSTHKNITIAFVLLRSSDCSSFFNLNRSEDDVGWRHRGHCLQWKYSAVEASIFNTFVPTTWPSLQIDFYSGDDLLDRFAIEYLAFEPKQY